jgi:alpha-tubulin suppressor-like RCC1 family protein
VARQAITALAVWLLSAPLLFAGEAPKPPAFPGAEGFGAASAGGRGGKVIKVTNLNAKGPGSLQAACETPGARIVVFDVAGVIKGNVRIRHPNIYIAGQTAPGAGITLAGRLMGGGGHDVTIRFLRVRPTYGVQGGGSGDCTQLGGNQRIILDHVSVSWGNDENMDFCVSRDLTVQWCAIEESKLAHEKSCLHNYGMILGYVAGDATLHHNLFAHHSERAPLCGLDTVDHRNNVIYNVMWAIQYHPTSMNRRDKRQYRLNLVGCYFKDGPAGPMGVRPWLSPINRAEPGITDWKKVGVYGKGNYWSRTGKYHDYDPKLEEAVKPGSKYRVEKPWEVPAVKTQAAEEAYRLVLAQSGCLPRDAVSRRMIREVSAGTGYWGQQPPAGGLMQGLTPGKPPADGDGDGMPDEWEKAHGLDPADPADNVRTVPAGASKDDRHKGYTYIEYYVNELADKLVEAALAEAAEAKPPAAAPRQTFETPPAPLKAEAKPAPAAPIAAGAGNTLALRDGTLWAWGLNWRGELGDGTGKDIATPVKVLDPAGKGPLSGVESLSASGAHVLARCAGGKLMAWGYNNRGQVGVGTTGDKQLLPAAVLDSSGKKPLDGVIAAAAGVYHSLAVLRDGTVRAWGCNMDGRLGDGTKADRHLPVKVKGLEKVVAVAAGVKHSLALCSDGTVWAWGDNLYGELGDGTTADRLTPVRVAGLTGVKAIAAGWHHSAALRADGTVWAWGCNHFGQLGTGSTRDSALPAQVKGPDGEKPLDEVKLIAVGGLCSFAVRTDGTVWSWGWNYRCQTGDGTVSGPDRTVPVQVKGPGGEGFLKGVIALDAGGEAVVALLEDGKLLTWGGNGRGQIGDGSVGITWVKDGKYAPEGERNWKAGAKPTACRPWSISVQLPPRLKASGEDK